MSKLLFAVALAMLTLSTAACQNRENDPATSGNNAGEVRTASDACSHCAGAQTATAAGTCPMCGMKVNKS